MQFPQIAQIGYTKIAEMLITKCVFLCVLCVGDRLYFFLTWGQNSMGCRHTGGDSRSEEKRDIKFSPGPGYHDQLILLKIPEGANTNSLDPDSK